MEFFIEIFDHLAILKLIRNRLRLSIFSLTLYPSSSIKAYCLAPTDNLRFLHRSFINSISEGVLTEHEIITVAREFGEKMVSSKLCIDYLRCNWHEESAVMNKLNILKQHHEKVAYVNLLTKVV